MPIVTLTVRKPKSEKFKSTVLDAVHAALVSSGVPETDLFQRVLLSEPKMRWRPQWSASPACGLLTATPISPKKTKSDAAATLKYGNFAAT